MPFSKRNHSGAEVVDGMRAFSWYSTMSCRSHQTLGTECLVTGVHVGSQYVSVEHEYKRMVFYRWHSVLLAHVMICEMPRTGELEVCQLQLQLSSVRLHTAHILLYKDDATAADCYGKSASRRNCIWQC